MTRPAAALAVTLAVTLAAALHAQELELKAGFTGFDPGTSEGISIPLGTSPLGLLWYPAAAFSMEQTMTPLVGFSAALETDPVLMHRFQVQALIQGDYLRLRVGPALWLLNPPTGGDYSLKPGLAMAVEGDFVDRFFGSLRADLGLDSAALNSTKDAIYSIGLEAGVRLAEFVFTADFSWNTLSQVPLETATSRTEQLRWGLSAAWRRKAFPLALRLTAGFETIDWEWSGPPQTYHLPAVYAGARATWRVWGALRLLAEVESTLYTWPVAQGLTRPAGLFTLMTGVVLNLEKPWEARTTW